MTAAGLKAIAVDEGPQEAIEPGEASQPQLLPEAKNGVSLDDVDRHAPTAAPRATKSIFPSLPPFWLATRLRRPAALRHNSRLLLYCALPRKVALGETNRRAVSGIEDNIETRCSVVHDRSPASLKAGSDVKPKRAILRDKAPASSI